MHEPAPAPRYFARRISGHTLLLLAGTGCALAWQSADPAWLITASGVLVLCAMQLLGRGLRPLWSTLGLFALLLGAALWPPQDFDGPLFLLAAFALLVAMGRADSHRTRLRLAAALGAAPLLALTVVGLLAVQHSTQPLLNFWLMACALLLGVRGMQQALRAGPDQAQQLAELALLLQIGVAVLVGSGWVLQSELIVQGATDKVPMQFNTAAAVTLAALSLWLVLRGHRKLGRALSIVVVLIAGLALAEEWQWLPFSIGELLWRHTITSEQVDPGRMASNTALALLITVLGTWFSAAALQHSRWWPLSWICGMLVAVAALAVLAGYSLALPQARAFGGRTPMALMSAIALLAQGMALLMAGRHHDPRRHQQVWLPVLVLCIAVVVTLQVGRAVTEQRGQLAEQADKLRVDSLRKGVEHGLQLRFAGLQRMAERLASLPDGLAEQLFYADAALLHGDFPSLIGMALVNPDLTGANPVQFAAAGFPWNEYRKAQHELIDQLRFSEGALLSAPQLVSTGGYVALLAYVSDDPAAAQTQPRYLLAALSLSELFANLLGEAEMSVEFRDGHTLLYAHGAPQAGSTPQDRALLTHGRTWTLRVWTPAQPALDRVTAALLLAGLITGLCLALLVRYTGLAMQRAQESADNHGRLLKQLEHNEHMRAALDESEHELSAALGSMSDALMLLDPQWRIVYVNAQAGRLTRREPSDLLGQLFWTEFPETVGSVFQQSYVEAVDEQRTVCLESYYAPLDGWFEVRAYPHRRGLAIYFRNITASKRVEQEQLKLRLETERAQRLARLGSWELELPNGRLHCSPLGREILGLWEQVELRELQQLHRAVHPEDLAAVTQVHARVAAGEVNESEHSFRVQLDDGRIRDLHEIVTRVPAFEDRPPLLSGAIQDISELRAAERSLRQAVDSLRLRNRELQEFAFVASHDLQEPLRKIRTFADRLQHRSGVLGDPAALHDTERMAAAAARMQRLIEDLLAFSRVSQSTSNVSAVNLDQVLAVVLEDLSERIRSSAAQIQSTPLPTLQADATQMRQLLQNLLSNALKFTSPERPVQIRLSASMQLVDAQPMWTLVCEDNGIGFDPKHAERIFTPFQRLHGREVFEGTGIGLAIVRRIVERHGGSIEAHGQPGVGARFSVVLPQRASMAGE